LVWLYRSPIPEGRRGGNLLVQNDFHLVEEGEEDRHGCAEFRFKNFYALQQNKAKRNLFCMRIASGRGKTYFFASLRIKFFAKKVNKKAYFFTLFCFNKFILLPIFPFRF
jgi:hypothetical protein